MVQKLTPEFENMIRGAAVASSQDVMQLSSYFHAHPGEQTPWGESFTAAAYVNYFLPLNYARLRAVFREVERFVPADAIGEIWDFGSGPGTTHWVLEDESWISPRPLHCVETSREAIALHKRLAGVRGGRWEAVFGGRGTVSTGEVSNVGSRGGSDEVSTAALRSSGVRPGALAVFSYSFLEMQKAPPNLAAFDHVLLVEPSTRDTARQLMEWRGRLLKQGFHILAPCTHSLDCPLLVHSARDWCHMRIGFEAPDWWLALEEDLPMKNRSLTYSYLLLSRTLENTSWRSHFPSTPTPARVTGDTLEERGKTKQMVCRGSQREFVSWLHRDGKPPHIPHGALLRGAETCEVKGSGELRTNKDTRLEWFE